MAEASKLQVTLVVAFYMVAALVMVFVNKAVLNSSPNLPLLMLLIQFLIAVICLHLSALLTPKIEIPRGLMSIEKIKQLSPILISNVLGLTFNTLCLRGVDASFFQIARGLVLPLTIGVQAFDSRATPTMPVIIAGSVVTLGFFFGVAPSKPAAEAAAAATAVATSSPVVSLIWGVMSSFMTAIHAILIKRSLPYVDNSAIQLAYWTNASAAAILLPFVLFDGEVSSVWTSLTYGQFTDPLAGSSTSTGIPDWDWKTFVIGCLITGVVGFLLCVAGLLSIKITSPVTHMFSSACRSVLQTIFGVWIFHDILTVNRIGSIFVILAGSMYYTWVKSQEADKRAQASASTGRRTPQDVEEGLLMKPQRGSHEDDGSETVFEVADSDDEDPKHKSRRA